MNFVKKIEERIKDCWELPALSDYRSNKVLTYGEMAREMEIMHLVWKAAGLQKGEKIAIYARNCSNWIVTYMAAQTGGYAVTHLLSGFTSENAMDLVRHSESRILYTEKSAYENMKFEEMQGLIAVIDIKTMQILAGRDNFSEIYEHRHSLFTATYPQGFNSENVKYELQSSDTISSLIYTSGSTGNPKGVMLTIEGLSHEADLLPKCYPFRKGEKILSVLPYAHIFGLLFEILGGLCNGMHLVVLCQLPAPSILKDALQIVQPQMIAMVPLVLNKVTEYAIGELIHSTSGSEKLENYKEYPDFCETLRQKFMSFLGGKCELIFTGSTAIGEQFEHMLRIKLNIPLVVGYGMTESHGLISTGHNDRFKLRSCGEIVPFNKARIDNPNPETQIGELLVKGPNLFIGYYKNTEATKAVMTEDGWMRTGDLCTLDEDGTLYVVGRCKSLLLTSNGQNVYPEEIEVKLNALQYVSESIIIQRDDKFIALIVPQEEQLANEKISAETLKNIMNKNIDILNKKLPAYSQISDYEIMPEPFAKTPKGSIKRFMYS